MTVAELMVKIGISVQGAEKMKQVDKDLKASAASAKNAGMALAGVPPVLEKTGKTTEKSGKQAKDAADQTKTLNQQFKEMESWAARSAVKVDVLAASLLYVIDVAMKGAAALERLTLVSGIAPNILQGLQGMGARAGVSPEEMGRFILSMQNAARQMMYTGAGAMQWQMLSSILHIPVGPGQDPVRLLDNLHRGLMTLSEDQVANARFWAEGAGIPESIFAAARNPEFKATDWQATFDVIQKNLPAMNALNSAWANLKTGVSSSTGALVSEFTPALLVLANALTTVARWLSEFVQWLDRGSTSAKVVKFLIVDVAAGIGVAALALSGFAAAMGVATIASGVLNVALLPLLGTMAAIAAASAVFIGAMMLANYLKPDSKYPVVGLSKSLTARGYVVPPVTGYNGVVTAASALGAGVHFPLPSSPSTSSNTTVHQQVEIAVQAAAGRENVAAQAIKDILLNYSNQAAYGAAAPMR
jgi:hypothetical protein